jgi:hypothetical protein
VPQIGVAGFVLEIKALNNGLKSMVPEQPGELNGSRMMMSRRSAMPVTNHVADVILSWRYQLWDTLGLSSPMRAGHCMRWSGVVAQCTVCE